MQQYVMIHFVITHVVLITLHMMDCFETDLIAFHKQCYAA